MSRLIWLMALLPLLLAGCTLPYGVRVSVSPDGCVPDGSYCAGRPANYYDPLTRTVVLAPGQGPSIIAHELCHARQHEVVLESLGREPDIALSQWYLTNEAAAFMAAVGWSPDGGFNENGPTFRTYPTADRPFNNPLEDAAWTCAWYYLDRSQLDPIRLAWAETWLK